jgi:Dynamin family
MSHLPAPMLDPLQHFARWRQTCAEGLSVWLTGLLEENLCAARGEAQLEDVIAKLREDRFTVAIVAEQSRGKSELINALLFTEHGRRIVPSGAGRTTMCPTEFFCDLQQAPYIELLPIETRTRPEGIHELRRNAAVWERYELDPHNAQALAQSLQRVGETQSVALEEAQRLGLADESESPAWVDIPRWRHARVNLHHPLLATGLTVLDTPGLNALGNEPELTYAVLPTVDAVLFLLAADVGVTRSDKHAWDRYLGHIPNLAKCVVLNKIDGMWDELKSDLEIRASIARQAEQCAKALEIPMTQVFPLSALKGLQARISGDSALLSKSRLNDLEAALTQGLLVSRKTMLADRARSVVVDLFQEAQAHIEGKLRQAMEQRRELEKLTENTTNESLLQTQFQGERAQFEVEGKLILSLRKVIHTHTHRIFELLLPQGVDLSFGLLAQAAQQNSPIEVEKALPQALRDAQTRFIQARAQADAAVMVLRNARNMNGLKIARPKRLAIDDAIDEIERLSSTVDLDLPILPFFTASQRKRVARTITALSDRIKTLAENATQDAELWLHSLVTPLERTLRDRQSAIRKRAEVLQRMGDAQSSLGEHRVGLDALVKQEAARHEELLDRARAVQAVLALPSTPPSPIEQASAPSTPSASNP